MTLHARAIYCTMLCYPYAMTHSINYNYNDYTFTASMLNISTATMNMHAQIKTPLVPWQL